MKIQKNGGGGSRVGVGGGGSVGVGWGEGQGRCERRIEVFVQIKKNMFFWGGQVGGVTLVGGSGKM